jgi:hypothetical protein
VPVTTGNSIANFLGNYQLHPGHYLDIDLDFHFIETASNVLMPQGAYVNFLITVNAAQWNEVN